MHSLAGVENAIVPLVATNGNTTSVAHWIGSRKNWISSTYLP